MRRSEAQPPLPPRQTFAPPVYRPHVDCPLMTKRNKHRVQRQNQTNDPIFLDPYGDPEAHTPTPATQAPASGQRAFAANGSLQSQSLRRPFLLVDMREAAVIWRVKPSPSGMLANAASYKAADF